MPNRSTQIPVEFFTAVAILAVPFMLCPSARAAAPEDLTAPSETAKMEWENKLLNQAKNSKGYTFARQAAKYHFLGKLKPALNYCDLALSTDGKLAVAYLIKGFVCDDLEDCEGAIENLTIAQKMMPSCAEENFYEIRAGNYLSLHKLDPAMADINKGLYIAPKNAALHYLRAATLYKMHKFSPAIAEYNQAIKLQPTNSRFYRGRANCHRDMNQLNEAIADLTEAIKIDPMSSAYQTRAEIYEKLGKKEEARKDMETLHRLGM